MYDKAEGLKKRIRERERVVGAMVPVAITREKFEEALDQGPYDFVGIDSQHSPLNEERVASFSAMAEEHDMHVQFRIKHTRHTYLIGNYLDLGPCGVEVPQTELDSTVEEAIQAFYYPPLGNRSYGGNSRRGAGGENPEEYAKWWNRFGVLCLQLESVEAVTHCRQLAKPGVDMFSFGPTDLTFNLKMHPGHPFKTVDDCVRHVCQEMADTQVAVSHRNFAGDTREKYAEMGVTVFMEVPGR